MTKAAEYLDAHAADPIKLADVEGSGSGPVVEVSNRESEESTTALLDELLHQRRYSLFLEGHRWVDARRTDRLATLPIDRDGDDVWPAMPLP